MRLFFSNTSSGTVQTGPPEGIRTIWPSKNQNATYLSSDSHLNCAADSRENDINAAAAQVLCVEIGVFAVDRDENLGLYASSHLQQIGTAGMAGGM